ncbi:protein kinase [Streptomyces sp. NPDC048420]|uniref:protein kinase domain-containing protein n=1 Tax=Streptomyces sp. NPDC048420 TaxID=3155755 RepID=UPI0034484D4F
MSGQGPASGDDAATALRQTGASPLRFGDPRRVGPYVPVALLGSGGMGRVYLARLSDDRPGLVAVKVIRPEYAEDPRFRRRFEREASVHARLRTPHAPRLCGTGFEDELLWMATEYLPGFDLAEAVKEHGALETAAVWRLVAELGQALAALAVEGIVHRDLKPSNVLLSVRGAHVIDFGISKAADASAITGTGNRVGTPAYMSPEHLREGRSDTASDVFALAGTLVYATAGRAPFGDGTGVDVMHRVAFEEPNPEVIGEISAADAELGSLLTACLDKEPTRRPTPQDLIDAAGAHAVPTTWPQPLGGEVLARQQAYEALHHLPVAGIFGPRSSRDLPAALSARTPEPVPPAPKPSDEPAPKPSTEPASKPSEAPAPTPSQQAEVCSAEAPSGRSGPMGASARRRRKKLLVAAAGVSVCALAGAAFLLAPQDTPAKASPQPGVTSAVDRASQDASPVSPSASGESQADLDGAVADNPEGSTTPAARPKASDSAGSQGVDAPVPGTAPSASPSPTPSADSPSGAADTTPWLSECTYYSGNGRTRLGDSGNRVQQVQCMLTERGYSVGSTGVDGEFGSGTETAVQAFQSDRGLDADGIVGHDTWVSLRSTD